MYQKNDITKLHLGFKQKDNSSVNSVHSIVNRILLCSSSLVYSTEDLPEKYGIDICTLKNMSKKNSPCIAEMVRFMEALGIFIETEKSPYINFHLKAEQLKDKAIEKRNKIKDLILDYTKRTGRTVDHFIDYNDLDSNLVHSIIKSENHPKGNEFNHMLQLLEFFNIDLSTEKNIA